MLEHSENLGGLGICQRDIETERFKDTGFSEAQERQEETGPFTTLPEAEADGSEASLCSWSPSPH